MERWHVLHWLQRYPGAQTSKVTTARIPLQPENKMPGHVDFVKTKQKVVLLFQSSYFSSLVCRQAICPWTNFSCDPDAASREALLWHQEGRTVVKWHGVASVERNRGNPLISQPHVHSSTIYSSQDMDAAKMSISGWMAKEDVVHLQWNITQIHKRRK